MTDAELIDLIEQKTPDELTPEEIEHLRSRLAESHSLRELLIVQLQMETYLVAALGRVNITPEQIVARVQKAPETGSAGVLIVLGVLICLPLATLIGAVVMNAMRGDREVAKAREGDAPREGEAPAEPGPQARANPLRDAILAAQGKPPLGEQPVEPRVRDLQPPARLDKPAVPPQPPPLPWQAALDQVGPPPAFEEVAFQTFDPTKAMPQREDLRVWFEQVPGFNFQVHRIDTRFGPCGAIEGVARLRAPWPENAVLRLALENYNRLRLHFYHGDAGVTLVYYEDQNYRWAAYATTRETGKPLPKTWAIAGTDDDRCRRTELRQGGPIDIGYAHGELVLSRGDIVLVSAPLAGPPTEIFVEGRAAFEGIALTLATGVPTLLPPASPVVLDIAKPAELTWQASKPDLARIEKQADGAVRFVADKAKERVHLFAPLAFATPREVIFELSDISPGAGVHFVYEGGQAHEVIRFFHDRRSQQLATQIRGWDDEWQADLPPPSERSTGLAAGKCWVKLLYGCGNTRWWLSSDGAHWAQPEMAHDGSQPRPIGIGIQLVANRPDTHVTLHRVTICELAGLAALAPPELREKAVAVTKVNSLGNWLTQVVAQKPADVATPDWLRACAICSLGAGMHRDQAYQVLEALLDDMAARNLPLDQQLAALVDATRMCWDLRDGGAMRLGVPRRMWELGLAAADRDGAPAWTSIRRTFMSVPWFTHLVSPPELERIVRAETIQRAYGMQSTDNMNYVRTLHLFEQQRYSSLVDWLAAQAARDQPGKPTGEGLAKVKDGWRDPLVEELSKETYNTTTEIQSVLESEAWPEAARLITSLDAEAAPGVAPYLKDKMLLASLPVAVRLVLDDYPQVRAALGDRFGPLAKLRIGQAMAAGDAMTVEMATIQFAGTDAAAEAHQWLGDRALASGWFERAIAEYRRALGVLPGLASHIEPRIRLAAAMLGREEGQPVTTSVQFNELAMSPAEFEALVAEMRGRGNVATLSPAATSNANERTKERAIVPAAKRYETQVRSRLDGPVGDRPQEEVGDRRTNQFRVPWVDRQLATVVDGDVLYVSNRFQIAAYNLTNGQRTWQSQPPPGPIQRSQEWTLVAMRPLVTGNRIFARHLYGNNPTLACWEKSSGKLVWSVEAAAGEFFVSDPVVIQGQLGLLSIQLLSGQLGLLRWNIIDPESGEVTSQSDLIRLRNTWGKRTCCELTVLEDSLVAVLGGVTLSLDFGGKVRWVRKHVTIPHEEDPRWVLQRFDPPLAADGKLYIAQPGVRTVDCLDPQTGRQFWSVVLPEVLGIIGLSGNQLIVRTETDLRALDRATGHTLWRTPASELHSSQLVDDKSILLAARERTPQSNDQWLTRLTWLDAATGQPTATCTLPSLVDGDPRLGPLVPYKDRIFTFFGRGQHDPNRDVVELMPTGDADRPVPPAVTANPWLARVPPQLTSAAWSVLPDWRLLCGGDGDRTGLVPEAHGEREVFGVRSTGAMPIVLAREIKLPAMDRPRLRLRFANDGGQVWKLAVRLGEQVLKTDEIKDETHRDRWKTIEIDLARAAGQSGWLAVELQAASGDHTLWWKGAEVVY